MKRNILIVLDLLLAAYIAYAVTSFNNPAPTAVRCSRVSIDIADETAYGFLDAQEIKTLLIRRGLYPLGQRLDSISPRRIESVLRHSPFVNTAECCRTVDGHVLVTVTQRSPLVRIKSAQGDDYYLDCDGGIMPNSKYTSDLIIVTGDVSRAFARRYVHIMANVIMADDFWRNQIEQINVLHNLGIELVPRVGDHIVFLGYLPQSNVQSEREEEVTAYVTEKLRRLRLFYRYGLSVAGWNKYERIDVQYANQIICRRRPEAPHPLLAPEPEVHEADHPAAEAAAPPEKQQINNAPEQPNKEESKAKKDEARTKKEPAKPDKGKTRPDKKKKP